MTCSEKDAPFGLDPSAALTPTRTTYTSIMTEGKQKDLHMVELLLTEAVRILYENDEAIKSTDNPMLIRNYEVALNLAWGTLGRVRSCNRRTCA